MFFLDPLQLLLAFVLDFFVGDPPRAPHIARLTGKIVPPLERGLTRIAGRTVTSGVLFTFLITTGILSAFLLVHHGAHLLSPWLGWTVEIFVVYQAIAARDLIRHVQQVLEPLLQFDLSTARSRLAWIVGRDTDQLDDREISRATLETLGESTSDGFVAPLFWAVVAGAGGALLYRVVNTLDSMVGHRDSAYEKFGKCAARLDDLLNLIPARLVAILSTAPLFQNWKRIRKEAQKHASPNAGWPESALARAINVRLGGTNTYNGETIEGPIFNPMGISPRPSSIPDGIQWFWRIIIMSLLLGVAALILRDQLLG